MTTCRDAVGTTAKWMITLTNVVGSNRNVLTLVATPPLSRLSALVHNYHLCSLRLDKFWGDQPRNRKYFFYTFYVYLFRTNVVVVFG